MPSPPAPPPYDDRALAGLGLALLGALGVAGCTDSFGIGSHRRVCLLVVDGLGWELLHEHRDAAPYLASKLASARRLSAGFPSTTATSLTSIGTGRPPGEHGILGYVTAVPEAGLLLNHLRWQPAGQARDLRTELLPERYQTHETLLERAAADGVAVTHVGASAFDGSGFTRAALRGGRYAAADTLGEFGHGIVQGLAAGSRTFVFAYHGDLDLIGHRSGPANPAWILQLAVVDRMIEALAARLRPGDLLAVTADHGMVTVTEEDKVDLDTAGALTPGVRWVAGEARARYLHTEPGATDDVLAAWTETLADRAGVCTREQSIEAGWFGPRVLDPVRGRIGDVVVAAYGGLGLVRRQAEPVESGFVGYHGSLTAAELGVPLLLLGSD